MLTGINKLVREYSTARTELQKLRTDVAKLQMELGTVQNEKNHLRVSRDQIHALVIRYGKVVAAAISWRQGTGGSTELGLEVDAYLNAYRNKRKKES